MTFDNELILITMVDDQIDAVGNQIPIETQKKILCGIKSIVRNEYYAAAAAGLKPEMVFVVHAYEYEGQQKVIYNGIRYNVLRAYAPEFEEMELVCERATSDGTEAIQLIDHPLVQDLKTLAETILADTSILMEQATHDAYAAELAAILEEWNG